MRAVVSTISTRSRTMRSYSPSARANMDQYDEYLTDGLKAMLETYPTTFRIPVYQTRRTHAVPDWVAENTRENAVNAEIVGKGEGLDGAFGGYPFPILHGNNEQKAWQVIWNHLTRWRGVYRNPSFQ